MKIEVGMYIRYDGEISTITFINEKCCEGIEVVKSRFHLKTGKVLDYPKDKFVVSNNIIDLIEVGDYVNEKLVTDIHNRRIYIFNSYSDECKHERGFSYILEDDVISIVTKEQFESMEYRIGE